MCTYCMCIQIYLFPYKQSILLCNTRDNSQVEQCDKMNLGASTTTFRVYVVSKMLHFNLLCMYISFHIIATYSFKHNSNTTLISLTPPGDFLPKFGMAIQCAPHVLQRQLLFSSIIFLSTCWFIMRLPNQHYEHSLMFITYLAHQNLLRINIIALRMEQCGIQTCC